MFPPFHQTLCTIMETTVKLILANNTWITDHFEDISGGNEASETINISNDFLVYVLSLFQYFYIQGIIYRIKVHY